MKIRRIYAPNTRIGIQRVKEVCGSDAVILGNKKVASGVEIIAASDYDESVIEHAVNATQEKIKQSLNDTDKQITASYPTQQYHIKYKFSQPVSEFKAPAKIKQPLASPSRNSFNVTIIAKKLKENQLLIEKQKKVIDNQKKVIKISNHKLSKPKIVTKIVEKTPKSLKVAEINKIQKSIINKMHDELKEMQGNMLSQLNYMGWSRWIEQYPRHANILRRLTSIGLETGFSNSIVNDIDIELNPEKAWQKALGLWSQKIKVTNNDILENGGVITLIGPTGVGKTTTAIKLAANYAIHNDPGSALLISFEPSMSGMHNKLMMYGQVYGIPTLSVNNGNELINIINGFGRKKLIIIDTVGVDNKNAGVLKQLSALHKKCNNIKNHIVVSSNMQASSLNNILNIYKNINIYGCILTKIDEASNLGDALSVVSNYSIPFSYITNGIKIPDDIQPALVHRLISKAVAYSMRKDNFNNDAMILQQNQNGVNI